MFNLFEYLKTFNFSQHEIGTPFSLVEEKKHTFNLHIGQASRIFLT